MFKTLFFIVIILATFVGCAATKQAISDYKLGASNAQVVEQAKATATQVGDAASIIVGAVPGLPVSVSRITDTVVTAAVAFIGVWLGGRRLRKETGAQAPKEGV